MEIDYRKKSIARIIRDVQKKSNNKKYKCMYPCCEKTAINSHYLQQNGILDTISSQHNYIMFERGDVMNTKDSSSINIFPKKIGICHVLTQPIFCSSHDSSLFKEIEQKRINFNDKRSLLLLCYRTICGEIRKVEKCLEELLRLYQNKNIEDIDPQYSNRLIMIGNYYRNLKKEIENILFLKENYNNDTDAHYSFVHIVISKLGIFGSGLSGGSINSQYNLYGESLYSWYFIQIIPQKDYLHIIFVYDKNCISFDDLSEISSWENVKLNEIGYKLTYLLSHKIEGFGMSLELFESIEPNLIKKFCKIIDNSSRGIHKEEDTTFNLFNGLSLQIIKE